MHQVGKHSLTWPTFSNHLKNMMRDLMMKEDFSDVTIISEDKKHIKAHKNILSACSPVFRDILHNQNDSNSFIYLRGILFSEIESMIQFIYLGEATIYEERMNEFLAVAKSLEINQILDVKSEEKDINIPEATYSNCEVQTVQYKEKLEPQEIHDSLEVDVTKNKYKCEECHKAYSHPFSLHSHKQSKHVGIKYPCTQCNYKATQKSHLYIHIRSLHEGIKYPCTQCDYRASDQSSLSKHIQRKHDGVKYPCNKCDYKATEKCSLTKHIRNKHEGIKFPCNKCDYKATLKTNLKKHMDNKHKV